MSPISVSCLRLVMIAIALFLQSVGFLAIFVENQLC